jgi:pimeloyl-ACP methyl ester carboxylesterase
MLGRSSRHVLVAAAAIALTPACGSSDDDAAASTASPSATPSERCVVRLHGKGGTGADSFTDGGTTVISPTGNADGWGGRQWLYFPDDRYEEARAIVESSIEGCEQVIIGGFSNGASFAAALYCRGETFDGRVRRVVVDDPVVDAAVTGCAPDPSVEVTLYWTGALDAQSGPDWSCEEGDWTCQGGSTIGLDAYAGHLGASVVPSPFDEHTWYLDAPELAW